MKREHYRPFNPEQAKVGAPYGYVNNDTEVKIYEYFDDYCLGAYSIDGKPWVACNWDYAHDYLVMLPIATCQGKPVFVGDALYDANGSPFQVELSHTQSMIDECSWEAPKKSVETRMTDDEIKAMDAHCAALKSRSWEEDYRWMINQGIVRAIDDGDVVPKETVREITEFCNHSGIGMSDRLLWQQVIAKFFTKD